MYIPEMPEIPTKANDHALQDAASVAVASFMGAAIGTWIDNNTRFGRWINHSPTADAIFAILKMVAFVVAVGLGLLYLYFFIRA